MKSDLAFLKQCRDSSVIPIFARIKHRLNTPLNHQVFLKASLALVRPEISRVRKSLNLVSRFLLDLHLKLGNLFSTSLWARIDACSALKSLRLEETRKLNQASKFQRLTGNSNRAGGEVSRSRVSFGQISALNEWVSGNSGGVSGFPSLEISAPSNGTIPVSSDLRLSVLGSENIALGHLCARVSKSPLAPCISALKDPGSDVEGFLSRMVEDSSSSNLHSSVLLVNVAGCGPCADEGSPARAPCCSTVAYLVDSPVAG